MKKKLVILLAIGLFTISMTACGGGNSSEPDTDTQTEDSEETENNKTITSVGKIEEQYKFVLDGQKHRCTRGTNEIK